VELALGEIAAGLPFAASFAFAGGISSLREVRRRASLNEAVHELRRPLQALALAVPTLRGDEAESSLRMATAALARLDREINGEAPREDLESVPVRSLVEAAVRRWRLRAASAGGAVQLRWRGGSPTLRGGAFQLSQALDNLIINGIEHGGGDVLVEVCEGDGRIRLIVSDSGGESPMRRPFTDLRARISGRNRRGHGLRVVRRTAAELGGSFRLRRTERGTEAVLELPAVSESDR
jgi:signal transduction histidine kinase